jgi:hypothetical protein
MTTILLGMAGLGPFDADPQAKPPYRQLAQVKQGVRGSKRHAVITANVGGQAALAEKPLKHGKSVIFSGRGKCLTGEQETAGMVGDWSADRNTDHCPTRTRLCNRYTRFLRK